MDPPTTPAKLRCANVFKCLQSVATCNIEWWGGGGLVEGPFVFLYQIFNILSTLKYTFDFIKDA